VNPRYVAYARAHRRTPDAQLEHDRKEFPGGCMTGFQLWIAEQRREFYAAHPEAFYDRHTIGDSAAWDRWLGVAA